MSVITVQSSLPAVDSSGVPFSHVDLDFHLLRHAGQELWQYLWRMTHFGTREVRLTDREIAAALGKSLRWVQKALRQLLGHAPHKGDDPQADPPVRRAPRIDKRFAKGAREVAGRIIRIVVDFAKPRDKEKSEEQATKKKPGRPPAAPAAAPTAAAEPAPKLEPTSPEAAAWLKEQLSGMKAPAAPAKSEEELARRQAELDDQLDQLRRRRTSADPGTPPQRAGP